MRGLWRILRVLFFPLWWLFSVIVLNWLLNVRVTYFTQTRPKTPPNYGSADGSQDNPYKIASLANIRWLTQHGVEWDNHYIQTADIDASDTCNWNGGAGFSPIGHSAISFTGTYHGQGHTIENLHINRANENDLGLFGITGRGSEITNLGVVNADVSGKEGVGGLVGNNGGSVKHSYIMGEVSGENVVGGLVGLNRGSVKNSYSTGRVAGNGKFQGGLVGLNYAGMVKNSYAKGRVSGLSFVGGLVGDNHEGMVENSFWNTKTSGQDTSAGGTGLITAKMKNISTFQNVAWDIEKVEGDENSYPYLGWEEGQNSTWLQKQKPD